MTDIGPSDDSRSKLEGQLYGLYDLLCRFEGLHDHIGAIYSQQQHRYLAFKRKWRAGMYFLWVFVLTAVFSAIAFCIFVLIGTARGADLYQEGQPSGEAMSLMMSFLIPFLFPLPIALVVAGFIVGLANVRIRRVNKHRVQMNQQIEVMIAAELAPEVARTETQITEAREEFQRNFYGWFPERFLTPEDVAACWQIVHNHRASTVQETINAYQNDLHHRRVEDIAGDQLAEQKRQTRVAMLGNFINAAGHAATTNAVRSEGAATRATFSRPQDVNVNVRRR